MDADKIIQNRHPRNRGNISDIKVLTALLILKQRTDNDWSNQRQGAIYKCMKDLGYTFYRPMLEWRKIR